MQIVETKQVTRPNTNRDFFTSTTNPVLLKSKEDMGYVFTIVENTDTYLKKTNEDGSMVSEITVSNNGLLQTIVVTFSNLETYSHVDTCLGIELDYAHKVYSETDEFVPPSVQQYTQTGINQPFSCITTYTYNSETSTKYPLFDSFIAVLELSNKLTSLTNNGSAITAVHHYLNSEDFTENHWADYPFITSLFNGGVTRTIKYALL